MDWIVYLTIIAVIAYIVISEQAFKRLEREIQQKLGFRNWNVVEYFDECVNVKSRQALEKYDEIKFFKENKDKLDRAESVIKEKNKIHKMLKDFLEDNEFKSKYQYKKVESKIKYLMDKAANYRISVTYVTSAGNNLASKKINLNKHDIDKLKNDPTLLMGKGELNKYLREQQKAALEKKQHEYYEQINAIIDYANNNKESLVIKGSSEQLDTLIAKLFDRTVNSIKKIKNVDSEEWQIIGDFITQTKTEAEKLVDKNTKILEYYSSPSFAKIKESSEVLMKSQREFNEYINEKVQSISNLFGCRVVRNETINDDENNYIRPYKKTITPFTAEVSSTVFASAENSPLEYVVKYFYPNKTIYPEQIQKLHQLVEELETLKDAKQIIENYKAEYKQYLGDVPEFIMENDESGFYTRLGFANVDESVLTVEYEFSYTSGGGMAKRSFGVPMTEETIVELVRLLESKLTASAFAKEQRNMMTKKLRESIKKRDDFTCCICGNSTYKEPNLLLEIDHIVPVSKGGYTVENNLQTLCWKCNRSKSNK